MPYVSDKQRKYMHAQRGKKVPAKVVDEFDAEERKKNKKEECKDAAYPNLRKLININ